MFRYIEGYVQKVNPQKAPQVCRALQMGWCGGFHGGRVALTAMHGSSQGCSPPAAEVAVGPAAAADLGATRRRSPTPCRAQHAHRRPAPRPLPQVVGALLDAEADDTFINNLILSGGCRCCCCCRCWYCFDAAAPGRGAGGREGLACLHAPVLHPPANPPVPPFPPGAVRSLIPVESLVDEVERRNKLKMLNPFLEQLVSEGSKVRAARSGGGGAGQRWYRSAGRPLGLWLGPRAVPHLHAATLHT